MATPILNNVNILRIPAAKPPIGTNLAIVTPPICSRRITLLLRFAEIRPRVWPKYKSSNPYPKSPRRPFSNPEGIEPVNGTPLLRETLPRSSGTKWSLSSATAVKSTCAGVGAIVSIEYDSDMTTEEGIETVYDGPSHVVIL